MRQEFVFNLGLGDLFVIRTAGEVIDRSILATVEYGAEHLHIPLAYGNRVTLTWPESF